MSLLNNRAKSRSITVNFQSIRWPTTHEWNLAAFTDTPILERKKRKSSSTIDFFPVLRLVNYINNSQQQHQPKKIRWSSSSVSSVPFPSWRSARQVVFFFFSFTAFMQLCSRQSLAAGSLTAAYHDKMESLPKGWQRWDTACMLMAARGALYQAEQCQTAMSVWVTPAPVCCELWEVSV